LIGIIALLTISFGAPIVAVISFSLGLERSFNMNIDKNYRSEECGFGLLSRPTFEIIEKKFPFEQVILSCASRSIIGEKPISEYSIKRIEVRELYNDKVKTRFYWDDTYLDVWLENN
jgi:hypothetical protein